ncbi:MAG TPA: hypothetical protein VNI57_09480 [Candidatus Saccharimonadales bacterium]|nr:hypothetical protein [Candidatus Saccharimonadales bacterium]
MTDWTDPEAFWLNVTNALLGLVTIAAFLAVAVAAFYDVVVKWVRRRAESQATEPHAYRAPALGLTMADGGEVMGERPGSDADPGKTHGDRKPKS